jgi:hypothetical protein
VQTRGGVTLETQFVKYESTVVLCLPAMSGPQRIEANGDEKRKDDIDLVLIGQWRPAYVVFSL